MADRNSASHHCCQRRTRGLVYEAITHPVLGDKIRWLHIIHLKHAISHILLSRANSLNNSPTVGPFKLTSSSQYILFSSWGLWPYCTIRNILRYQPSINIKTHHKESSYCYRQSVSTRQRLVFLVTQKTRPVGGDHLSRIRIRSTASKRKQDKGNIHVGNCTKRERGRRKKPLLLP